MLPKRQSVLLAKIEATPGTDATPTGTDGAINFFNTIIEPQFEMEEREIHGSVERQSAKTSTQMARVRYSTEVQWDGTATEPTWAETLFPACGWVKSGQVYYPKLEAVGTNVKTLTFYQYLGPAGSSTSALRKVTGAAGTFTAVLVSGKRILFNWDFLGVWGGETVGTMPSPTYPTSTVYQWTKGTCTWNSVAWQALTATVNANNVLAPISDPSGDKGFKYVQVSDRYCKINIDPLKQLSTTLDVHTAWTDGTEYPLALYAGGVGNSLFKIDAPKAQVMGATQGERDEIATNELELACNKNGTTADQSLYFTFTAAT